MSNNLVSVICLIISLTLFQNPASRWQCHQMCIRVPVSLLHLQKVLGVCGFHIFSFAGVVYQFVSNLYVISGTLVCQNACVFPLVICYVHLKSLWPIPPESVLCDGITVL